MTDHTGSAPPKQTGLAHLWAATRYSGGGLVRLTREAAFRHEVAAGVGLAAVYAVIDVTAQVRLSAAILFLLLIAVEAVNTAIEEIIDRISPELSETGKHAKDLGSLAVLCLIAANSILFFYALAVQFGA